MALTPGRTLSSYEILAPLGAGGMGEVYRARDGLLGREVAIKVLPEAVANDQERVLRFDHEARVLASLEHGNIGGDLTWEPEEEVLPGSRVRDDPPHGGDGRGIVT